MWRRTLAKYHVDGVDITVSVTWTRGIIRDFENPDMWKRCPDASIVVTGPGFEVEVVDEPTEHEVRNIARSMSHPICHQH